MRRFLLLLVLLLAVSGAANAYSIVNLLVNSGSTATTATATGMTADGRYVSFHTSATATIYLFDASTIASTQIGLGSSAGVAYQNGNVVAAGNITGAGASKYVGGSWTTLPLTPTGTSWSARCISATSSNILIGGDAFGVPVVVSGVTKYTNQAYRYKDSVGTSDLIPVPSTGQWHIKSSLGGNSARGWNCVSDNGIYAASAQWASSPPNGGGTNACVGPDTGLSALLYPYGGPSYTSQSYSEGINRTGTRAVGMSWSDSAQTYYYAVYWDAPFTTTTTCHIIPMASGSDWMEARVASDFGGIVAGYYYKGTGGTGGKSVFLWDSVNGVRDLVTVATNSGIDMTGWVLTDVTGISATGGTLCGLGTYNGVPTSWVITIPEPGSLSALMLGLFGLVGIYRRRR